MAVDRAFATQRQILEAIIAELGTPFEIPAISAEEAALLETADILSQDLRFECSSLMAADSFPWHVAEGFVSSIKQVAAEFCQCRGLRQLKILVTGNSTKVGGTTSYQLKSSLSRNRRTPDELLSCRVFKVGCIEISSTTDGCLHRAPWKR